MQTLAIYTLFLKVHIQSFWRYPRLLCPSVSHFLTFFYCFCFALVDGWTRLSFGPCVFSVLHMDVANVFSWLQSSARISLQRVPRLFIQPRSTQMMQVEWEIFSRGSLDTWSSAGGPASLESSEAFGTWRVAGRSKWFGRDLEVL